MKFFVISGIKSSLNPSKGGKLLPLGRPERGLPVKFIETKVTAIKLQGFNL